MAESNKPQKRCAIYTRKSSEEGLEQAFNSLQAQRQACEAFVRSPPARAGCALKRKCNSSSVSISLSRPQVGEGWRLVETAYDDGGFSGATMGRPALKALLADVREKRIDVIVVYKVDRLTRSLADFAKMVEIFDAQRVSFVAVTQQFNTTTSMGRLTLNVLLSFAQFEREVTGERIRDKIAASKQKGMWMGGTVPLGYDVRDRRLLVNAKEAETVRLIFQLYVELKSVRRVWDELDRRSIVSKSRVSRAGERSGGVRFGRGALYQMLANPIYVGEIRHKQISHPGQHEPIIERATWLRVEGMLKERAARQRGDTGRKTSGLLVGKLFDENGEPLYACWAKKGERRYRYFVSRKLIRGTDQTGDRGWRLPAEETEQAVTAAARRMLSDRGALASALKARGLAAEEQKHALETVDGKVKSFEENALIDTSETIIERVELKRDGMQITLDLRALLPTEPGSDQEANLRMTRLVPMQMKRRGIEIRLVIPGEAAMPSHSDPALLRALARSYQWFGELASGRATSIKQIAAREGVSDSYVRHLVPLGLLAPAVVESICAGQQPVSLSAERLKAHADLPIEWGAQQEILAR
jgi:site-specific DNA recombinase